MLFSRSEINKKGGENMKWMGNHDHCDICGESLDEEAFFVDGKTRIGHWALMCPDCFVSYGIGLGVGKGQSYDAKTLEKIGG
jgi:hypothetical protein